MVDRMLNRYCPLCGTHFYVSPSRLTKTKGIIYCSRKCQTDDDEMREKPANRYCKLCGKPFYARKQDIERGYGHYCSRRCSSVATVPRGPDHFRYRGQTKNGGYIMMVAPDNHPRATKHGYIPLHTLVMEQHLGRYLEIGEVIHHINGIKDDNRLENLQLMSVSEHHSLHMKNMPRHERPYKACPLCGTMFYAPKSSTQKTCSRVCGQRIRQMLSII